MGLGFALAVPYRLSPAAAIVKGIFRCILCAPIQVRFNSSKRMSDGNSFPHFATDAIHAGQEPEQWSSRSVIPPISLSTTFKQYVPGHPFAGFEYGRSGNPTRAVLETCFAALEGAHYALVFASGLAGTMTIVHTLQAGDHIISIDDVYGGTNRYFQKVAKNFGLTISFIDMTKPENLKAALQENTKLVWIESPTNPLMKIADIAALSKIAHEKPGVVVAVDNTFMSSYFQRPLDLGADIAFHSVTKYMNGHTDVIMGAVMLNDKILYERLKFLQNAIGAVPSPFDCYLANRGVKTLHLRMKEHMKNGLAVAHALERNPRVERVIHPGLTSHPQHELAKRQMRGYSGMITFYIKGGRDEAVMFLRSLKIFCMAESLGGYESLAEHPAIMTHASVPIEQRQVLGISDNLVRLSVGLEDVDDLIEDVEEALAKAVPL